jgi:hypothetical protein
MAIPTSISDLNATPSSNSPAGTDSIGTTLDDFIRAHAAIIRQVSDAKADLNSPVLVTPNLGTPSAGILTNCTFPTLNQNTTGSSASLINGGALNTPASGDLSNCTAATDIAKGVVELATTAEAATGTDTSRAVTPAGVAAAITAISAAKYNSGQQTITSNGDLTLPHGLGAKPLIITYWYYCVTDEHGWVTGEYIHTPSGGYSGAANFSVSADATNIYVKYSTTMQIISKTTSGLVNLTLSKWKLVVDARL